MNKKYKEQLAEQHKEADRNNAVAWRKAYVEAANRVIAECVEELKCRNINPVFRFGSGCDFIFAVGRKYKR